MKKGTIIQVPIFIFCSLLYGQDTLTIMNYNVHRFDGNTTVRAKQIKTIVDGTQNDDIGDYRPGIEALHGHGIRSPLLETKFTKK